MLTIIDQINMESTAVMKKRVKWWTFDYHTG